jgi:phosphate transport system substrate-binding protein
LQNKMASVDMINLDGKAVAPNAAAFQAAAANADWAKSDSYYVILTNQPGAATWPIAGATFILMYKQPVDAAASADALKFFAWAYAKGGKQAEELDYVPLPPAVVTQIEKTWASEIKTADGKPVYTGN